MLDPLAARLLWPFLITFILVIVGCQYLSTQLKKFIK